MHQAKRNSTESVSALLRGFQATIETWKAQFDKPPHLELDFYVNTDKMLCVNNTILCPIDTIDSKDALTSEWDMFFLKTNTGDCFDFLISWPFNGSPEIVRIIKSHDIYVKA